MKAALLDELLPQVRRNCLVSDADYWGYYSLCGLLLRLRELFRFEKGIRYGERSPSQEEIGEWIGEREAGWSELEGAELEPVSLEGAEYDPFDVDAVNEVLEPAGLLYGAGHGIYMKPVFFLADLDRWENLDGCRVYTAGTEYVRDLSLHPAMLRGDAVVGRLQVTEVLIAQKYEELQSLRTEGVLHRAFAAYGITETMSGEQLKAVADAELRTYIHHELGEAAVSGLLEPQWSELLSSLVHGRAAAFVREIRDVLADSVNGGMLDHIIRERKTGSLAFHIGFLTGYRRPLSCRIEAAFRGFRESGDWDAVERARTDLFRETCAIAETLLELGADTEDPKVVEQGIVRELERVFPH